MVEIIEGGGIPGNPQPPEVRTQDPGGDRDVIAEETATVRAGFNSGVLQPTPSEVARRRMGLPPRKLQLSRKDMENILARGESVMHDQMIITPGNAHLLPNDEDLEGADQSTKDSVRQSIQSQIQDLQGRLSKIDGDRWKAPERGHGVLAADRARAMAGDGHSSGVPPADQRTLAMGHLYTQKEAGPPPGSAYADDQDVPEGAHSPTGGGQEMALTREDDAGNLPAGGKAVADQLKAAQEKEKAEKPAEEKKPAAGEATKEKPPAPQAQGAKPAEQAKPANPAK
jgi:hypothetical protein